MLSEKIAAVMSSLAPPIKGKPTPIDVPKPRAKTPTTPGLGAKMREETAHSLEKLLKQGSFTTGLENLVKVARSPMVGPDAVLASGLTRGSRQPSLLDRISGSGAPDAMAPNPMRSVSMDEAHANIARMRPDAQKAVGAVGLPEARAIRGGGGGAKLPPAPPARGGGGGMLGGLKMPRMGRTMGLMGLGAAAAAMYGMHHQNEEDRQKRSLIYAPLPGSVMQ